MHEYQKFSRKKSAGKTNEIWDPVRSLSTEVSFENTSSSSSNNKRGENKFPKITKGTRLKENWVVKKRLGSGAFSEVYLCTSTSVKFGFAVKVLKSNEKYFKQGENELRILQIIKFIKKMVAVMLQDPRQSPNTIKHLYCAQDFFVPTNEKFVFPLLEVKEATVVRVAGKKHFALCTELCGGDLLKALEEQKFFGFPLPTLRNIARQLFFALAILHSFKLVHTDLKPENIAASRPLDEDSEVKLLDFGNAVELPVLSSRLVGTRHYRPPEVVLGLFWNEKMDVWSLGCVLFELATGKLLFPTHDALEHLSMVEKVLGKKLPVSMLVRSAHEDLVGANGQLTKLTHKEHIRFVRKKKTIEEEIENQELLTVIKNCLTIDPAKRPSIESILNLDFFAI